MRAEGFVSTADAVRQRLHDIGSQTFKDDEVRHHRMEIPRCKPVRVFV